MCSIFSLSICISTSKHSESKYNIHRWQTPLCAKLLVATNQLHRAPNCKCSLKQNDRPPLAQPLDPPLCVHSLSILQNHGIGHHPHNLCRGIQRVLDPPLRSLKELGQQTGDIDAAHGAPDRVRPQHIVPPMTLYETEKKRTNQTQQNNQSAVPHERIWIKIPEWAY